MHHACGQLIFSSYIVKDPNPGDNATYSQSKLSQIGQCTQDSPSQTAGQHNVDFIKTPARCQDCVKWTFKGNHLAELHAKSLYTLNTLKDHKCNLSS